MPQRQEHPHLPYTFDEFCEFFANSTDRYSKQQVFAAIFTLYEYFHNHSSAEEAHQVVEKIYKALK